MKMSLQTIGRALAALLVLAVLGAPTLAGAAPARQEQAVADSYSLGEMGFTERVLEGPVDSASFQFGLPANWKLVEGATIGINLQVFLGERPEGAPVADAAVQPLKGSRFAVDFNGKRLSSILLERSGAQRVEVPISADVLKPGLDGRYTLRVTLDARVDCTADQSIQVIVGADSRLALPHEDTAVPMDLAALPRPFFQRTFFPEQAMIVVPDEPTVTEIQAALTVAAGFGRMTGNQLGLNVRRAADLAATEYQASQLILVGKPAGLPLLAELKTPIGLVDNSFERPGLAADDGLAQLIASPWDDDLGVLVVSGNSDAGVLKAAQAVAANQLLVDNERAYSIVSAVSPAAPEVNELGAYSFGDLGYEGRRASGVGIETLAYDFFIPEGYTVDEDAGVDLQFSHSRLLDYDLSGVTVLVNDKSVGSLRLSDDTSSLNTSRFSLPASAVRAGRNSLSLRANLVPRASCFRADEVDIWFEAWPESLISLPLMAARPTPTRSLSLAEYPEPFTRSPDLNQTAIVVPADDPASWETAAALASDLGSRVNSSFIQLAAAYADDVAPELRESHDLIIIGRATGLPIVGELSEALPAPFEAGSDRAINRRTSVTFSPAELRSEGYLQLLSAPWNGERLVLAVLGSDAAAVRGAVGALTRPEQRAQLGGNFALVVGDQLIVGGNRISARPDPAAPAAATADAAPAATAEATTEFSSATPPRTESSLLLPLVLSVAVMLAVVGGVLGLAWSRRRNRS